MSINSLVLLSESLARIISKVASAESIYQLNYTYQIQAAWSSQTTFSYPYLALPSSCLSMISKVAMSELTQASLSTPCRW